MRQQQLFNALLLMFAMSTLTLVQDPVTLSDTESRAVRPKTQPNREYILYVGFPNEYQATSDKFKTLYFLDGYNQFGLILQTYRLLRALGEVPPLLIVAISYPGTTADFILNRALDFTPTTLTTEEVEKKYGKMMAGFTPASGGAADFLQVLADDIIPFIEREYRVDPVDRAIFGHSYGGLFSVYVLFNRPELFQRYLIGSSAVWWDDFAVLKDEERYAASHRELAAQVIATVGTDEGPLIVGAWHKLCARMMSRAYIGFSFTPLLFDGETHVSGVGRTYSAALRSLYSRK